VDRKINLPTTASFFPAAKGWHLLLTRSGERHVHQAATFAEAVELLPPSVPGETIRVAIPTRLAVFERLTLPSHDTSELEGMVQHQLEKTLPYPVEETNHGFEILSRREADPEAERGAETTLIAGAVHRPAMETLCTPLLQKKRYPSDVTFRALHAAEQAPSEGASCGVWMEEDDVVFAIFEEGVLTFAEIAPSPEELQANFSHILLSAELASASTSFQALLLDPELRESCTPLAKLAGLPERAVIDLCTEPRTHSGFPDLTPEAWRAERARQSRNARFKQQCIKAALAYAACIVLGFVYLGFKGRQLRGVERELEATRPQVDHLVAAQARWKTLAPAIDQRRFTVELLYHVFEAIPSADTRVTQFIQGKTDFIVQGEASNAAEAIALVEKLKGIEGLNEFDIKAGQPILLPPNDRAQFNISGKL